MHRGKREPAGAGSAAPVSSKAAKAISPARRAAFAILERVLNSDAHSDDLLHGPATVDLSSADRSLTTALVLGTLRWKIALDAELTALLVRPDVRLPSTVATALELGAFQLRHMDRIPAHAAIDESVELVRAAGHAHATGMVNAVLRKVAGAEPTAAKLVETPEQFATRLGHPGWLVKRWAAQYGRAAAFALCEYGQREPGHGSPGVEEGENVAAPVMVIDQGSRLVAELAAGLARADALPLRVWDTCAAPGGKTVVLASRLPEAAILATDVSPRRLRAMAARFDGLEFGERVRCLTADAAQLPAEEGEFDLILCDAPCSGTGTLARNPEIRLRLEAVDLARQAKRQREILAAALPRLRRGGRLLYSTCSLEPEENDAVVEAVLRRAHGVRRVDLTPTLTARLERDPGTRVRDGCLRTLPGVNFAGDGFFAAALERG